MSPSPGLIDEVRHFMRLHHYSIHTERAYCDWIKRFVRYHGMTGRRDLQAGETKIEAFLTHLAIDLGVSPSTQNQAMNALVFLYKKVIKQALDEEINAVRAPKKIHVPVVMSREEVAQVITLMEDTAQLVVKLLYGKRIMEAVRLRVQDIDFPAKLCTVRSGKGGKDRFTTFPASLIAPVQRHLARVRLLHEQDLAAGFGEVYLPHVLARIYLHAAIFWA